MASAYLLGLGLIAVLAIANFAMERRLIAEESQNALLVGIAAEQIALVHETGRIAHELQSDRVHTLPIVLETRLQRALDRLAANHVYMVDGDHHANGLPADIATLLMGGANDPSAQLMAYANDMGRLAPKLLVGDLWAERAANALVARAASELVPALERVQEAWAEHAFDEFVFLTRVQQTFLAATLLTLLVEVIFIFRPMVAAVARHMAEVRSAYDAVQRQLRVDELTGIGNRRALMETLAAPPDRARAVLQLDLDHFKTVNDLLGHDTGDRVLIGVAEAMRALKAPGGNFRLGGDEFVIVLDDAGGAARALAHAEEVIARIDRTMPQAVLETGLAASIGVAVFPETEPDPSRLLADADIALYEAKALGRHQACLFAPAMRAPLEAQRAVKASFQEALARGELLLHYQPQVDLASGRVIGLEALARWQQPDGDVWGADRFIPFVEDSPLILEAAHHFLDRALEMAQRLRALRLEAGPIGLNAADLQLRDATFAEGLLARLEAAGLGTDALSVEVVERALAGRGQAQVAQQLARLDAAGVLVELDDFGTGHASLTHIKAFPVRRIKIDRRFVAGIGRDVGDETIVRATIEIAQSFARRVIAEGVETEAQREFLRAHGCVEGQGFLFAPPLPATALVRWLETRQARVARGADAAEH